jgi:N-acetylneuraminate synthase/N,N'-diacetyllegionaminate synthase
MSRKPILIAEIGGNHEGDLELAYQLGLQAIEAGADYIKYQVYTADGLVNPKLSEERYKHFKRLTISTEDYLELAKKIEKAGGKFLSSIWNIEDVEVFAEYMDFFKIGSGDLTCYPILEKIVKVGKPIVLSTGLSTMEDVQDAIEFICNLDPKYKTKEMLTVMQCTSMYPTHEKDLNLSVINTFKAEFENCDIGYSHHHVESWPIDIAYTLGANMIEFHFTHDKSIESFRDHQLSLTKEELIALKKRLDLIQISLGSSQKVQTKSEIEANHIEEFRRGAFLNKDLKEGDIIKKEDLVYLRPEMGISAKEYQNIIGKKINQNLNKFDALDSRDFI